MPSTCGTAQGTCIGSGVRIMLRLHYAIFRVLLRECENAMLLVMPENAHLVQTDTLSYIAGIALSYEMSRNIAHALSQKKFRIPNIFTITQSRNLAKSHEKKNA